jgi:hypothetical protein
MADQSLAKQLGKNIAHRRNREPGELRKLGFTELLLPPEMGKKNGFIGLLTRALFKPVRCIHLTPLTILREHCAF